MLGPDELFSVESGLPTCQMLCDASVNGARSVRHTVVLRNLREECGVPASSANEGQSVCVAGACPGKPLGSYSRINGVLGHQPICCPFATCREQEVPLQISNDIIHVKRHAPHLQIARQHCYFSTSQAFFELCCGLVPSCFSFLRHQSCSCSTDSSGLSSCRCSIADAMRLSTIGCCVRNAEGLQSISVEVAPFTAA